jgi:hypothetical protein
MRENPLPDDANDAADQDAGSDHQRGAARSFLGFFRGKVSGRLANYGARLTRYRLSVNLRAEADLFLVFSHEVAKNSNQSPVYISLIRFVRFCGSGG